MGTIWNDKNKEKSICSFFATLAIMGMIGAYYMQNTQKDLSWMNIFVYGSILLGSLYAFVFAQKNKERNISTALLGILVLSALSIVENVFGVLGNLNPRKIMEVLNVAFKVLFAFSLVNCASSKKTFICRWWYLLLTAVCVFAPAVLQALFWVNEAWMTKLLTSFEILTYAFFAVVALYALVSLALSILCLIRENKVKDSQNSFALWANIFYGASLLLIGAFGILRAFNAAYVTGYKYGNLLFELSMILVFLAAVHYNKSEVKGKRKK